MIPFTDDDLLELKTSLIRGCRVPKKLAVAPGIIFSDYMIAFLARLEAAETVIRLSDFSNRLGTEVQEAYRAWCKATGK